MATLLAGEPNLPSFGNNQRFKVVILGLRKAKNWIARPSWHIKHSTCFFAFGNFLRALFGCLITGLRAFPKLRRSLKVRSRTAVQVPKPSHLRQEIRGRGLKEEG